MNRHIISRFIITCALSIGAFLSFRSILFADGTYYNIGTPTGLDGGYDAVSWSTSYPITVDSYGKYVVPIQAASDGDFFFSTSNDAGNTWLEFPVEEALFRPSIAYDGTNDVLHVISTNSNGVFYRRYSIHRDPSHNITGFSLDSNVGSFVLDSNTGGTCSSFDARNPIALITTQAGTTRLLAFWSVGKTCAGSSFTENRVSFRDISLTNEDANPNNWMALNGISDAGATGQASVSYNALYSHAGVVPLLFQQSATIQSSGGGSHAGDIYYFTVDENDTHSWTRLGWNSDAQNWSDTWTNLESFGGDVSGAGYGLNQELLTKPVYDDQLDRVYVGIARWLDETNGDTQSLYYVDAADTITLAGNIYSAGGAHSLYPTLDIAYDQTADLLYTFFLRSGGADSGHISYTTYDGSSFSSAEDFFTEAGETADIPILFPNRYDNRLLLFFRKNKTADPSTPPHEIFFGYLNLSDHEPVQSGTYSAGNYAQFFQPCAGFTDSYITESGSVSIARLEDEFGPNRAQSFADRYSWGTWDGGSYTATPGAGLLHVNAPQGAYVVNQTDTDRPTSLTFRARFSSGDWQHVGLFDDTSFGHFFMFSTFNNGQLNTRSYNGATAQNTALGNSYLNEFHDYTIEWDTAEVRFYIDSALVDTYPFSYAGTLRFFASNNSQSELTDLVIDSMTVTEYQATTGTYTSCPVNAGVTGAFWKNISSTADTPAGTSYILQARTSRDNAEWSSWTTVANGSSLPALSRFLQYRLILTGTGTTSPTVTAVTFEYGLPTLQFVESAEGISETNESIQVAIQLETPLATDLTIPVSIAGTAEENTDFTVSNRSFFIESGETTASLDLEILEDTLHESDETVVLSLALPSSVRAGADTTFTLTIENDDASPAPAEGKTSSPQDSVETSSTSPNSQHCSALPPGTKPPKLYAANGVSGSTVQLWFAAAGEPFTAYAIEYGPPHTPQQYATLIAASPETRTTHIHGLAPDTTYQIRIRALNDCAPGDWSESLQVKTHKNWKILNTLLPTSMELTQHTTVPNEDVHSQETARASANPTTHSFAVIPKLVITLTDAAGKPLSGANLVLHSTPREATTNADGQAIFTDVEKGAHTLFIEHEAYRGEQAVYLESEHAQLDLNIQVRRARVFPNLPLVSVGIFIGTVIAASVGYTRFTRRAA